MVWHSASLETIYASLDTSEKGLSDDKAGGRLKKYGANVLPSERPYSRLRLFLSQFESPLIAILASAVALSLYIGHYSDAIFIGVVLLINTTVAFYQEDKVNRSLRALKKIARVSARVLRGGQREIDSAGLVLGDVVFLSAGDKVPADIRLIEAKELSVNESSLTGEWSATFKYVGVLAEKMSLGDRTNMAYLGTLVEEGSGAGVVVATGSATEFGGIVSLIKETSEHKTPLQKKILSLSRIVGAFVLLVSFFMVVVGYTTGQDSNDILIAALALSVSAIPAGILPAITVILVLGMRRILAHKALVRKLIANETLGGVTVICTDKTGTLTKGIMQVSHILTGSRELLRGKNAFPGASGGNGVESHIVALKIATLTNDAFIENPDAELHEWVIRGRPTERAFLVAGAHAGLRKEELERAHPLIDRLPFDSTRKFAASLHEEGVSRRRVQVVGAPEILLSRVANLEIDGRQVKLDSHEYTELVKRFEALTAQGLRVIACAYRIVPGNAAGPLAKLIENLTLVGFIALQDPLREDAKEAISETRRAGIRTIIITGDHRLTARSIGEEIGLAIHDDEIIEGVDIERMSEWALADRMRTVKLCARVSPHHKLRLVEALRANNEVVAMVGDGVNDAPALKAADIGIAVGTGTEVAKEVSDMVLLDNSFKTIVKAIEQGRIIFQNIRKVFVYLVADDFSQLFIFFCSMLLGLPLPLLAAQILWINLVEDGLPDIALTTEQEIAGVMERPPRRSDEPIVDSPLRSWMGAVFVITGVAAFVTYATLLYFGQDLQETRTTIFALMGFDSLLFAYSVRSFHRSLFRRSIFSNRYLNAAAFLGMVFLFVGVYVPFFQGVLSTVPLDAGHWLIVVVVGFMEIILIEAAKWFVFMRPSRLAH